MRTSAPTRRLLGGETLFALASLLWLGAVWLHPFFPTQDGPDHLNNANILLRLLTDPDTPYREFFRLDFSTGTNTFTYFFLAALLRIADPLVAEKILVSVYIALYVFSVAYAVGTPNRPMAMLFLPYLFNLFTNFGFYGFIYSYCAFFLYYGSLKRWRATHGKGHLLVMAVSALLGYFFHVFGFWMMVIHFCVSTCLNVFTRIRAQRRTATAFNRHDVTLLVLAPLLTFLPVFGLIALFRSPATVKPLSFTRTWEMLAGLCLNSSLFSYGYLEVAVGAASTVVLLAVAVRNFAAGSFLARQASGPLLTMLALLLLFVAIPDYFHNLYFAGHRLNIFIYFMLLLHVAELPLERATRKALGLFSLATGLFFIASTLVYSARFNEQLQDYADMARHIARDSVVLNISFAHKGVGPGNTDLSARVAPLEHASGYLAVKTNAVTLDNYEPCKAFSIIKYLPDMNPYEIIGDLDTPFYDPDRLDVDRYEAETGRRIDCILLFGRGVHTYPAAIETRLDAFLARDYTAAASSADGLLTLYKRNP